MSQVYTLNILDALPYTYLCTLAHCLLEWGLEGPIEAQDIPYACWMSWISHTSQPHKPSLHNLNNTEVANWKRNERCTVADPGGVSRFSQKPLLKVIYSNRAVKSRFSNRAVGLRCSNYSSFIGNNAVIIQERLLREKYEGWWPFFFLFFWSSTQSELVFCQAETPFQKS